MGLKYDMFAIKMNTEELFEELLDTGIFEDYTELMRGYREFKEKQQDRYDELCWRKNDGDLSEDEWSEEFNAILDDKPDDDDLREYYEDLQDDEIHRYSVWWKGVPDNPDWSFGGYTAMRGWAYIFDNTYEALFSSILMDEDIQPVYLLSYHHNRDAGDVQVMQQVDGEVVNNKFSSNEDEFFEFESFAERVKSETGLPLNTIHDALDTYEKTEWDYQVGSEELVKDKKEEAEDKRGE